MYMYTYTDLYIQTCIQTYIEMYTYRCMPTYMHTSLYFQNYKHWCTLSQKNQGMLAAAFDQLVRTERHPSQR